MLREKRQRGYQKGEWLDDVAYFLKGARTKVQRMLAQHRSILPSHVAEDLNYLICRGFNDKIPARVAKPLRLI